MQPLVRPRVVSLRAVEPLPMLVEDAIAEMRASGAAGLVRIDGPPGSGKSTALGLVDRLFGAQGELHVLDDASAEELEHRQARGLVVYAADERCDGEHAGELELAPWGRDDVLEYLLAAHADQAAAILARTSRDPDAAELRGNPELWSTVLDELAARPELPGVVAALESALARLLTGSDREPIREASFYTRIGLVEQAIAAWSRVGWRGDRGRRLARHAIVQNLLAAEQVIHELRTASPPPSLRHAFPRDLLKRAAALVREMPDAAPRLEALLSGQPAWHATAASLLHAVDRGWLGGYLARCAVGKTSLPNLSRGRFVGAHVRGAEAKGLELVRANCARSDWSGARLDEADLYAARFRGACLRGAEARLLHARSTDFTRADLRGLLAPGTDFAGADLERALLSEATLVRASFRGACLDGADLTAADVVNAVFEEASLAGTRLQGANLHGAKLSGVDLRHADLSGACLERAKLRRCNLEGVSLPGARLAGAMLEGALLTGSRLPSADLRGARLTQAGLAEIDWPACNLTRADLTGVSFHLGSSRSGLVAGYPSQGTRTGFYTDDTRDLEFKNPELVRKANLRDSDLTGATVEGADFYLVDLRGVRCSASQLQHFRRCGAILDAPG